MPAPSSVVMFRTEPLTDTPKPERRPQPLPVTVSSEPSSTRIEPLPRLWMTPPSSRPEEAVSLPAIVIPPSPLETTQAAAEAALMLPPRSSTDSPRTQEASEPVVWASRQGPS